MELISGGIAEDQRGHIRFVNDFDMSIVKRFYIIKNGDTELIRGWRAHKIEQRWFFVLSGSFSMNLVKIDNFENVPKDLEIRNYILDSKDIKVVHIDKGYGTTFQALEPNSELLVFADFGIEHAVHDNYTYPLDYFVNRK